MESDNKLYDAIKHSNIDLILSVPCKMLEGLINLINLKNEIRHIPITREEEGIGIAAGAFLGGTNTAILMQNSGIGNSINAIKSLLEIYEIPVVLFISHRGAEGEKISAQIPMGEITFPLLKCIGMNFLMIDSVQKVDLISEFILHHRKLNESVAIVLERSLWRNSK